MEEKMYCPICYKELELMAACGAAQYFCKECKRVISSKKLLTEEEVKKVKKPNSDRKSVV